MINRGIGRCGVTDGGEYDDPDSLAVPGVEMRVGEGEEFATGPLEGGAFVKAGAGRGYIRNVKDTDIRVKEGELLISSLEYRYFIPADSILHVDANAAETLCADSDGESLLRWNDVGGLNEVVVNENEKDAPVKAKIAYRANGNPAFVDMGPACKLNSGSEKGSALKHEGANSGKTVKTGFAVYDSTGGGAAVFGSYGNAYPQRGLPHDRSSANIICDAANGSASWCGIPALNKAVANGTAVFKRNGATVDPFNTPFLGGLERLSFRYPTGRQVIHFGVYGQGNQSAAGGLKIGEMILFDRELTDAEMASTEAYLAKKWFDIDTPGYLCGSAANKVEVDAGATLTVLGDGFTVAELSGSGMIDGDVKLAEGGTLTATITEAGTLESLTVQGTLALGGGSLVVEGDERNLPVGEYEIVSANKIVKGEGEWALPESKRRRYSLQFASDKIVLMVRKPGFYLICR